MKRTIIILIAAMVITLSGCIGTKIYLGGNAKRDITEDQPVSRAIDPTSVPAGGTWGTVRGILNTNFANINGTLDSVEVKLAAHSDSITNYSADILLRLLKSDTTSMLANYTRNGELNAAVALKVNISDTATMLGNYTRNGELNSGLAAKVNVSDTSTMLANYALTSELGDETDSTVYATRNFTGQTYAPKANPVFTGVQKVSTTDTLATQAYARSYGGTGTVTVGDVRDEIADSLNVLRPTMKVGNGTVGPYFDGSQDGGQILYFYGDNGFYTALQGGAPVANRSYRLPIAALPSAGTTSLLNIDQYGNMGFVTELSKVRVADSTGIAAGNYVTRKALNDSIAANLGGAVGITLNGGTLTLTGGDDLTFVTGGDFSYTLPQSSGGTLMLMSEIQDLVNDSLDTRIGGGVELSDVAVMLTDSLTQWVSISQLVDSLAAFSGGISSGTVADMINDSIQARLDDAVAGVRLVDSVNYVNGYMSRYDGVTGLAAKINVADSTGNAPGNYVTRKALVDSLEAIAGGLVIGDVRDEIADSLNALRPDILTEADLRKYDSDTTTLFVFGAGSGGSEADTALFTTSNIYGAFKNKGSDTLYVTSIDAVMIAGTTPLGTDTLSIQIYWNDTINVTTGNSFVVLNTNPLGINSTTTGTVDNSFNNSAIPPNVWVFCKSPGVVTGRKPKALIVNMTGYKRNRSY